MKVNYPIIVQKMQDGDCGRNVPEGEKSYQIYCMAPYLNAFNEVIEVRYRKSGWPNRRWGWAVSKGSSGDCDAVETYLVMRGYKIAVALTEGDESVVTPRPLVDKFLKAYWAKQKRREKRARELRAA